jgi:outer membrane autotransporter protein
VLDAASNSHELVSKTNALAGAPTAILAGLQSVWDTTSDGGVTRQTALRDAVAGNAVITAVADPVLQEDHPGTVWMSALGNWTKRDAGVARLGFNQDTYGFMAGADFGSKLDESTTLLFGLQGGYVTSKLNIKDGTGSAADIKGASFGGSLSLLHSGFFANASVSADLLNTDLAIAGFASQSVSANTIGARGDMGYRADMGGFYVEPMVSALFSHTNLDDFAAAGVAFKTESADQTWLGTGLRAGVKGDAVSVSMTGRVWNNFADDNALLATPVGPSLTLTDDGLFQGVFGEVEGQLAYALGENTSVFAEGKVRFDGDAQSILGKFGVNMTW